MVSKYDGLDGASVLITGGARGLGRAVAEAFARQGANVALADVDAESLARTAAELEGERGGRVIGIPADLGKVETLQPIIERTIDAFGRIDVLVNNAALVDGAEVQELTPELFDRVIAVNLRAPLFLSRAAMTVMKQQGGGRIVNVASMAARTGGAYPTVVCYAASKGGLLSMTRSLARIGAASNVLVNAILPSNIDSPMLRDSFAGDAVRKVLEAVPLGRPAEPQEVAELVLWLSSPAASYVTGASWDINGGWFMS